MFTKGPWAAENPELGSYDIVSAEGVVVARRVWDNNTALIAASPDLAEACVTMYNVLNKGDYSTQKEIDDALSLGLSAIEKLRGEA